LPDGLSEIFLQAGLNIQIIDLTVRQISQRTSRLAERPPTYRGHEIGGAAALLCGCESVELRLIYTESVRPRLAATVA